MERTSEIKASPTRNYRRLLAVFLDQRWVHFLLIACLMTGAAIAARALPYVVSLGDYIDNQSLDYYFKQRGSRSPEEVANSLPQTRDIVLVETNHELPRTVNAALLDKLHLARAVAFDLMFVDRVGQLSDDEKTLVYRGKSLYAPEIQADREDDAVLSRAIQRCGNVIIPIWPEEDYRTGAPMPTVSGTTEVISQDMISPEKGRSGPRGNRIGIWSRPADVIWTKAAYHANVDVDADNQDEVVRKVRLFQTIPDSTEHNKIRYIPCLGLALAAAQMKIPQSQLDPSTIPDGYFRFGNKIIPIDSEGEMLIDYVGGRNCFEGMTNHINYMRLFDFDEPSDFVNKLVIIGEVSEASKEIKSTPVGLMPGMQIHANVAATLLSPQGPPRLQPTWVAAALSLLCSLMLVPPLLRWPVWGSLIVAIVQVLLLIVVGGFVFSAFHLVIWPSAPVIAIALTYNAIALYEHRRARETLGKFIGREMVAQTLNIFSRLTLGGKVENATAFFCDLRGYSALPEIMDPTEVTKLVNEYTGELVKVVKNHKGRPIDYQGDGVFVLFERSLAGERHAEQAVRAALELRGVFEALTARWSLEGVPDLDIGIGIASGTMSIGIVGAIDHMKMGAVGNAVNVAARVQALSEVCGHRILVTREVCDSTGGVFAMTNCGMQAIRGRTQPLELFGVLGIADRPDDSHHEWQSKQAEEILT